MVGIRIIVQFSAESAEAADERVEALLERCRKTGASEPGCVQYEVFRSAQRPTQFALLEHWDSQDALDQHWAESAAQAARVQAAPVGAAAATIATATELYAHELWAGSARPRA